MLSPTNLFQKCTLYKFLKAFKNLYLDEKLNFDHHVKEIKEMSKATKEIVVI